MAPPVPPTIPSSIPVIRRGPTLALGVAGLLAAALLSADQTVTVGPGMTFTPASVTVVPGETVTWTWAGVPHSTTSNATSGPEFWDSGVVVLTGATFSHTFSTPGNYPYYCSVHSFPGGTAMNGVVQVGPPPTATPTPSPPGTTFTPTPTPPAASPTPTPASGASPPAAIPMLDGAASLIFAFGLLAAALAVFLRRR